MVEGEKELDQQMEDLLDWLIANTPEGRFIQGAHPHIDHLMEMRVKLNQMLPPCVVLVEAFNIGEPFGKGWMLMNRKDCLFSDGSGEDKA